MVRWVDHDERSSVLKTRKIYADKLLALEEEGSTHLPTHRAEPCSELRILVRRNVNLQVRQRMEAVELPPVLPA